MAIWLLVQHCSALLVRVSLCYLKPLRTLFLCCLNWSDFWVIPVLAYLLYFSISYFSLNLTEKYLIWLTSQYYCFWRDLIHCLIFWVTFIFLIYVNIENHPQLKSCWIYFKLGSNLPIILTSYNRTLFTPVCGWDRFIYHNHKTQCEVFAVTRIECAQNYINLYDHCLRTLRPTYICIWATSSIVRQFG